MPSFIVLPAGLAMILGVACAFPRQVACAADPCMTSDCTAPNKWFAGGKTPKVVFADFPKRDDKECAFYRWAWQSFLYLTQSEEKGNLPRFISFHNENELFDTPDGTGTVQTAAAPLRANSKERQLSLSVRNSPHTSRIVTAKAIAEAGSQGVVVDHNNRCLYFSMHFNPDYVDFIRNKLSLRTPAEIALVPPSEVFPVGSVEMKSSWRALTDKEKAKPQIDELRKSWFITEAMVPTLIETDLAGVTIVKADANKPRPETVALVGLHVVGVTPGHHEFVWASFEHRENSPTPVKKDLMPDEPVNNVQEFTFYKRGTKRKDANINPVDDGNTTPPVPLRLIDEDRQTLAPVVEIFRQYNSGNHGIDPDDDVCTLNDSVRVRLASIPDLSVWSHYELIGAVWLEDPDKEFTPGRHFPMPPPDPDQTDTAKIFAGELRLSNSTMETFTQVAKINCFGCHDTFGENQDGKMLPGLGIKISHGIRNAFLGPQQ